MGDKRIGISLTMQIKRHLIFLLFFIVGLLTISCDGGEPDVVGDPVRFPRMIADEIGFEIKQKTKPERIASVDLMSDEVLLDLVGPERMVILTAAADDPSISNVADKALAVPNRITMDPDRLIEEKPEISFLPSWTGAMTIAKLRARAVPVYYSDPPANIEEIKTKIAEFAFAVGEPEKGKELIGWMDEILDEVNRQVAGLTDPERLSVVFYRSVELRALGKNTIWDDMVARAGLVNAVGDLEIDQFGFVYSTWEDIERVNPDIIFLAGRVAEDPEKAKVYFDEVMADPVLKSLNAFQNQRVYMAKENLFSTKSHYIVLGVKELASLAYPELFE